MNHETGIKRYQDGSFETDAATSVQIDQLGTRPHGLWVGHVVLAHWRRSTWVYWSVHDMRNWTSINAFVTLSTVTAVLWPRDAAASSLNNISLMFCIQISVQPRPPRSNPFAVYDDAVLTSLAGAGVETCINNTSFPPAILHQRPNQYSKKRYLHFRAATRTITSATWP